MKNHRKILNLFILIIFSAVILAGCSSSSEANFDSSNTELNNYMMRDEIYNESEIADSAESGMMEYKVDNLSAASTSSSSNLPADRKIIRDANITMEVEDVEQSYENMLGLLTDYGGYEARREMQGNYDGYPTIGATLKIPANRLDDFLSEIKSEGKTISSNITSNDISDQYYDSKIRITTLEKTLENYYEFLENAQDVDEQLRVTRYINDITNEIEQLKGSIKRWDSLVDYSTVTLNLYRPYEAPEPVREIQWNSLSLDDMLWLIKDGFISTCSIIVNALQRILIFFIAVSPVLIPAAAVLFFLIRRRKKTNAKRVKNLQNNNSIENTPD